MRLNTRPVLAGVAIGAVAMIALLLLPRTAIESLGARTHLASIMDAAKPPLGTKARFLIGLIPFVIASVVGLVLGFVLVRKPKFDDYGAYPDYDLGAPPAADPFAPMSFEPPPASETTAAAVSEPAYQAPAPADRAAPPPPPLPAAATPLDSATAADLAEIADAIVRLGARLDTIEDKIDKAPTKRGAPSGTLADRIARITDALDAAG